jgi:protein SCO1
MPTAAPDTSSGLRPAQWLAALGVAIALSGAYLTWRHWRPPVPAGDMPTTTVIDDRVPLPEFSLRADHAMFTNADLRGQWSTLIFGYTSCIDVCPSSLAKVKEAVDHLRADGKTPPKVVFITVDPQRDTPARLDAFVHAFDRNFIAAVGDDRELAQLSRHLGVGYQRIEGISPDNYRMDHTNAIFLVDPELRLKAVFSWPQNPKAVAVDIQRLTSAR